MPISTERTPVLRSALAAWDALNPGDPAEDIEDAATALAEAARVVLAAPGLTHALDNLSTLQSHAPVAVVQRAAAQLQAAAGAFASTGLSPFGVLDRAREASLKSPMLLAREAMDRSYGIGTEWEEPNAQGDEHFARAQAESEIEADEILAVIVSAIEADRSQPARRRAPAATPDSEGAPE